jgi:diguanylate cyclase (GGDEF)-like protein
LDVIRSLLLSAMDTLNILTISNKAGFKKQIKGALKPSPDMPAFEVNQISSLPDTPLDDPSSPPHLILVDLDSLELDVEDTIKRLHQDTPGVALILISDTDLKDQSLTNQDSNPTYLLPKEVISNPLFPSFVSSLVFQSSLIHNKESIQEDLNKRLNELLLIRKASLHLTLNLSLDAVLEAILESAMDLVDADDTHVFLYEHGVLSFGAALFDGHQQKKPFMHPRPHGLTYQVARNGKMLVVNDVKSHPLFEDRRWEGSIISLPLKIGNKVLGVMNVALKRAHEFTENELQVIEFLGDQASIAIQNANLYEQAQQEIADRIKAEEAIKHLANHDALTGLPNRRLFNERINLEISRSQRNNQKIGIMLFDLDHLKKVNDSYGHNVGDLLLQSVAQRLLGLLRKSDTVARMGGDEFLLILPEMQQPGDAIQTADRILEALSTPFHLEGYQVDITTSIGIAFYPDDGDDVNTLVKKADIAMYKAKDKGGNVYHFYTT